MKKLLKALFPKIKTEHSSVADSEVYILSYPKTGRTWLRVLIGRYLSLKYNLPEDLMLQTEEITTASGLPKVSFTHEGWGMRDEKTYTELTRDKSQYGTKKVILIGRDVKDTLVSAYFQATKRINVFEGTLSEFIVSEKFGVLKVLGFYDVWLKNRHIPQSFLFISYEELHQDPHNTLLKVLNFIGETDTNQNLLEQSVEYSSFNNLKKMETENKFKSNIMRPKNSDDPESYKVRKGKVGGYTEYLSEEDQVFIDKTIEEYKFDFKNFYKI